MILAALPANTGSDCLSDSDIEKENLGFIISYFFKRLKTLNIIIFSKTLESFKWVLILPHKDKFYECI